MGAPGGPINSDTLYALWCWASKTSEMSGAQTTEATLPEALAGAGAKPDTSLTLALVATRVPVAAATKSAASTTVAAGPRAAPVHVGSITVSGRVRGWRAALAVIVVAMTRIGRLPVVVVRAYHARFGGRE